MSDNLTMKAWPYPAGKKHRAPQSAQAAWEDYAELKPAPQGRRVRR